MKSPTLSAVGSGRPVGEAALALAVRGSGQPPAAWRRKRAGPANLPTGASGPTGPAQPPTASKRTSCRERPRRASGNACCAESLETSSIVKRYRSTISWQVRDNAPLTPTPTDEDYRRLLELRTGLRRFLRWSESQAEASG